MNSRDTVVKDYVKKKQSHDKLENDVKDLRFKKLDKIKEYGKTEDQLKAIQSVGMMIGEILNKQSDEKFLVKVSSGSRYVVGVRPSIPQENLKTGTRVALDGTTLTIMKYLSRQVDPLVHQMLTEDPGKIGYADIGGLHDQMKVLRETIELPITNPELFKRVGISAPKGVLLYGPPGTGKTLLARALACNVNANFMKVVASSIMDKYIGKYIKSFLE